MDCESKINREERLSIDFDNFLATVYGTEEEKFNKYLNSRLRGSTIPKFYKRLPGTFWAITSFFNPSVYKNKYTNFKFFRESSKKQGLKLIVVELTFNSDDFEIQDEDAEKVIRIKGSDENIMWQKEALLNIALKQLPNDCDKVAWVDSDLVFHNHNWVQDCSELLENFNVIQTFSTALNLKKNSYDPNNVTHFCNEKIEKYYHSLGRGISLFGKEELLKDFDSTYCGIPGYAWAIRREIIEDVGGFFDQMILGSADLMMAFAFYDCSWNTTNPRLPEKLIQKAELWENKTSKLTKASVYFCPGIITHLWHGKKSKRNYRNRWNDFLDFDPSKDIIKSSEGIYSWAPGKGIEQGKAKSYFNSREEETE
jgi:hypothetical protein